MRGFSLSQAITGLLLIIPVALAMAAATSPAAPNAPIKLEIQPTKRIYSSREGVMVAFVFTARERTRLCLEKDFLSQMRVKISRPGTGDLPLQPLVVHNNRTLFQERMDIRWLEAGDSLTLRANLKRYRFAGDEHWTPGEYSVNATFNLCEQREDEEVRDTAPEVPVPAVQPGWFMIMS